MDFPLVYRERAEKEKISRESDDALLVPEENDETDLGQQKENSHLKKTTSHYNQGMQKTTSELTTYEL